MLVDQQLVAFVPSTDLDRSRRFYEGTLGLALVSADPFGLVLRSGEQLIRIANVGPGLRVQPFTVLGWRVDDLPAAVRDLAARGVEFLDVDGLPQDADLVWTAPDGAQVAWFLDPDGNTLSLDRPAAR